MNDPAGTHSGQYRVVLRQAARDHASAAQAYAAMETVIMTADPLLDYLVSQLPLLETRLPVMTEGMRAHLTRNAHTFWCLEIYWNRVDLMNAQLGLTGFPTLPYDGMRLKFEMDFPLFQHADVRARGVFRHLVHAHEDGERIAVQYHTIIPLREMATQDRKQLRTA